MTAISKKFYFDMLDDMKKSCKKLVQKFRIEKVLKRKGNKLYVKWKGYENSFNSWINEKDLEQIFFK